jgi:serine/threonine-protein kinase
MPAIAPDSVDAFLGLLRQSNILPAERLTAVPSRDDLPADAASAASELVRIGLLTNFQAGQLLQGRYKGFRIGSYVIREQLGRGGMGAVYLAEHVDLHRRVALKLLTPAKGEDQKLALERFLREARASAALDHPNIVRTFDVARAGQTPYIVMEYVDGETLQQMVDREGPVPFAVAAGYIAQAAAGLRHAHERGFVHRDIKPANLMRDRSGAIKVLDMGLARSGSDRDKLTEVLDEGAVVGTADFISPEQALGAPVDGRADIYCLGACFYTLVTGKTPFEGNTTQKLIQHQMKVPPALHVLNPAVPRALSAVVARMMAKKPADRYQSAAEVIDALAPWVTGTGVPAPKRPARRSLVVGAAVALVLTLCAVGLALALGRGAPAPNTAGVPAPVPQPPAEPNGPAPKGPPPKVEPPARPERLGPLVHRFDPADVAPFAMRLKGGTVTDGKRGTFPAGVAVYSLKDGEAEFGSGPVDGTAALSVARYGGDTHIAFELEREVANQGMGLSLRQGTTYQLRFRHWSDASGQLTVSVHALNYRGGSSKTYPSTGSQWRAAELTFARGPNPLRVTFAAVGPVGSKIGVGAIELYEVRAD